jgi:hypothetical protein
MIPFGAMAHRKGQSLAELRLDRPRNDRAFAIAGAATITAAEEGRL